MRQLHSPSGMGVCGSPTAHGFGGSFCLRLAPANSLALLVARLEVFLLETDRRKNEPPKPLRQKNPYEYWAGVAARMAARWRLSTQKRPAFRRRLDRVHIPSHRTFGRRTVRRAGDAFRAAESEPPASGEIEVTGAM